MDLIDCRDFYTDVHPIADILERLAKLSVTGGDYQDDLALCYNNRAALQIQKGNWKAAIESHQRAIALQEKRCSVTRDTVLDRN